MLDESRQRKLPVLPGLGQETAFRRSFPSPGVVLSEGSRGAALRRIEILRFALDELNRKALIYLDSASWSKMSWNPGSEQFLSDQSPRSGVSGSQ